MREAPSSDRNRGQLASSEAVDRAAARRRPRQAVVAGAFLLVVAGIIAAIAIPAFIDRRFAAHESAAIGAIRSIVSAQVVYFERCNAYASTLPDLGADGGLPTDLIAAKRVTWAGYVITLEAAANASHVQNADAGCDDAVTDYFAYARPVSPGTSGGRYFAADARGTVMQNLETMANPIPGTATPVP